jgi:hypothetical protein
MATDQQTPFSWDRIAELLGIPARDPRIQDLFDQAGLNPDELWREVRVGIYSMPPHDQQPSPIAEIDLSPSYGVRLRFKHASLVAGAKTASPTTFVFSAVTYFLESRKPEERFRGQLPWSILATDDPDVVVERVGSPPTHRDWEEGEETGYLIWEDRNPVLHVLFSIPKERPLRVNVFLPAKDSGG